MQYTKQDNQLQATKTLYHEDGSTYETTATYTREFLNNQITAITTQRDEMIALKEAELAEVNLLLAKCDELEITE